MLRAAITNERIQLPEDIKDNEDRTMRAGERDGGRLGGRLEDLTLAQIFALAVWNAIDKRVTKAQVDLNTIGTAILTLDFMTVTDEITFRAAMRLLAAMLYGGNRIVQQGLYKFFHAVHNEIFFTEIRSRLVRIFFSSDYREDAHIADDGTGVRRGGPPSRTARVVDGDPRGARTPVDAGNRAQEP